jgi:hypothetical protein
MPNHSDKFLYEQSSIWSQARLLFLTPMLCPKTSMSEYPGSSSLPHRLLDWVVNYSGAAYIGFICHDNRHGVGVTGLDGCMGCFSAAQTFQPVLHMRGTLQTRQVSARLDAVWLP